MARALFLAERGRGGTGPNPLVGAVVVSPEGVVLGQGAHRVAGGPHAEPLALDEAREAARGATLYCTLEPCCHVGRTPPCVERIASAGVRRVVTAIEDPNPRVNGAGHAWLRAHGIVVETGVCEGAARRQNAPFVTWMLQGRPWTILKTASSVEGLVGLAGRRVDLSGASANRWMHRQRAWIDALMVGAGTVLADDPALTARGAFRRRPLTRVIVDWQGRLPTQARVWSTLSSGPVIMVVLASAVQAAPDRYQRLAAQGVQLHVHDTRDLRGVSERLGQSGVQSLLLEGGPGLQQAWLDAGLVDWVQWLKTPVTLASGGDGVPMVSAVRERLASDSTRISLARVGLGDDVLVEGQA
ncbi:MAG: bifunctional diaminohydroxyphosphoribosylaminopyrimidine deaminase/5-amino-6-(5-phosphoribosylamino)uracil reductase RibD [Acidobacteria bacterium]|nr:bifunctional diaminohydroxyphosphoribosylaminopyrimidine deaminase/5-amino-6-(5-phosphoribosylamino)uracil reductase RibD [Acidobacteriota bacterium]